MSKSSYSQCGASLIEALVTLLIFTVGLLGLAAMQLNALKSTADSGQRSQAAWLMNDLAERMRSNPDGTLANYQAAPICAALPNPMCADYYDPATGAKVNAADCNTAQMAAFDRWEAQCSYASLANLNPNGTGRFNSRDFLIAPDGNALTIANDNTVSINWFSKAQDSKAPSYVAPVADAGNEQDEDAAPAPDITVQSAAVEIIR